MKQRIWFLFGIATVALFLTFTFKPIEAMGDKFKKEDPKANLQTTGKASSHDAISYHLNSVNHGKITAQQLKGKVVLVNFWATWCPPCTREIPHLEKLYNAYKGKGVVILGMSVDSDARGKTATQLVKDFIKVNELTYPIGIADRDVIDAFGNIQSIPSSFVIDRNGKIVKNVIGYQDYETFENLITPLL